jgi:hypothetical protein
MSSFTPVTVTVWVRSSSRGERHAGVTVPSLVSLDVRSIVTPPGVFRTT